MLAQWLRKTISPYGMDELTACGTAGLNSTDLKTVDFNVLLLGLLCGRKEAPSFGHLSLKVSLRASPTLLFRTVIGEMKAEGVNIGWFFKQKIMWTELQKQVLETTLIGS